MRENTALCYRMRIFLICYIKILLACLLADYGRGFRYVKYFAQFFHNLAYFNTIFNFLANKKCLKNGKIRFYTDLEHKHSAMRKSARFLHAPAA